MLAVTYISHGSMKASLPTKISSFLWLPGYPYFNFSFLPGNRQICHFYYADEVDHFLTSIVQELYRIEHAFKCLSSPIYPTLNEQQKKKILISK